MAKLAGKVALVTGAGSGIGEAIAGRRSPNRGLGWRCSTSSGTQLELTAGTLSVPGMALIADVSDSAEYERAVAEAEAALGPLDVLVNNAGVPGRALAERIIPRVEAQMAEAASGSITTPLESTVSISDSEWQEMLGVHLFGTFYGTRAALRTMGPRRSGVIINVASICGIEGCTGFAHYSAAKGGILAFTRAVAKEAIIQGIRVNALAPGYVDTPMNDTMTLGMRAVIALQTPLGRLARPAEIANAAVFLASDDASFIVGETLSPNGGFVTV